MTSRARILVLFIILFCRLNLCHATITVDSVHVTLSTCPNNGTAKIYARSTNNSGVLLFNVVSGPVTYPQQNDSTFYSLYAGNYAGWVHDVNSFDSTRFAFTITGHYQSPQFTLEKSDPFCSGQNNGYIICTPDSGTGFTPFSWQIISPYMSAIQSGDTFSNIGGGNYSIKMTDGCSEAITNAVTIGSGGSALWVGNHNISFINCHTAIVYQQYVVSAGYADFPVKLTITTSTDTIVKYKIPSSFDGYSYHNTDTIYNVRYGDYLTESFTDTCGYTLYFGGDSVTPFSFNINYINEVNNCTESYVGYIELNNGISGDIGVGTCIGPLTVLLVDSVTNLVVDSFVYYSNCTLASSDIPAQIPGHAYHLTVKDSCGDVFTQNITWPQVPAKNIVLGYSSSGCLDSTVYAQLDWTGFNSDLNITILSGPSFARSTKPGFAYYDTIIYPVIYTGISNSGSFVFGNVPVGNYTFIATDACGDTTLGSFNIPRVSNLSIDQFSFTKQCNGAYLGYVAFNSDNWVGYQQQLNIRTLNNGVWDWAIDGDLNLGDLNPGEYIIELDFYSFLTDAYITASTACWSRVDTINLAVSNDSTLKATDVVTCNSDIYIHIDVDSNNGVLPFTYEIISGPETHTAQNTNLFIVHSFGSYVVGVIDYCGNVDTRQVTVDTGRFDPIERAGGWCEGSRVQLFDVSSPYFTYVWYKPDSTVFIGDTLTLNPVRSTDTGFYIIKKIVQINGCLDSAFGSYHLIFKDTFPQSIAICPGESLHVGDSVYTTGGTYYNELTGAYGCDSIVVSTITMSPTPDAIITPDTLPICYTGTLTLTASGGTSYLWTPGNYSSETITVSPDILTTYTVIVTDTLVCPGRASLQVFPVTASAQLNVSNLELCSGDSQLVCTTHLYRNYLWTNGSNSSCIYVSQPGNYQVTVTSSYGCSEVSDSLAVIVTIVQQPVITAVGDTLICQGIYSGYQWYLNSQALSGETSDTLADATGGSYTVQVADSNGCTISSNPYVITSISNVQGNMPYLSVYPNPKSTGAWEVMVSPDLENAQCEVYDVDGKVVYNTRLTGTNNNISISLVAGVYIMRISANDNTYSIKLVQF